jgi:hypothetical protein
MPNRRTPAILVWKISSLFWQNFIENCSIKLTIFEAGLGNKRPFSHLDVKNVYYARVTGTLTFSGNR